MSDTYTQLYFHIVFAVKGRQNLLLPEIRDNVYKYITGIVKNKKHKVLSINGMSDHIHLFMNFNPNESVSSLIQEVKRCSTNFINDKQLVSGHFSWQEGYGAFSYSRSQIGNVCRYIENQENHHRLRTFREEYEEMLQKFAVDYKKEYILKGYEEME